MHISLPNLASRNNSALEWHHRLGPLRESVVLCDNLPQILEVRDDAVLSGSFFWHEVVPRTPATESFVQDSEALLAKHRPLVAASGFFATRAVRKQPGFVPVGLYRFVDGVAPREHDSALIAVGAAANSWIAAVRADVALLARKSAPREFRFVFVEPNLLPRKPPSWMRPAVMDAQMFARVGVACIRPGMGKVNDCLTTGSRVFAFHEPHPEMEHIARTTELMGVGERCASLADALERAVRFLHSPAARAQHEDAVASLRADGVQRTAQVLVEAAGRA